MTSHATTADHKRRLSRAAANDRCSVGIVFIMYFLLLGSRWCVAVYGRASRLILELRPKVLSKFRAEAQPDASSD
jgi:hypothetical protein